MSVNAKRCAENFATANERAAALAAGDGGEQLTACLQRRMFSKGLCVSNNDLPRRCVAGSYNECEDVSNQFKLARELYNPAVVGMGGPSVDMLDAAVEKAAEELDAAKVREANAKATPKKPK